MVPEEMEMTLLADYFKLRQAEKSAEGRHDHIDIPFSVKTETNVLTEAGFSQVSLIEEGYSESFNAAMIVAVK